MKARAAIPAILALGLLPFLWFAGNHALVRLARASAHVETIASSDLDSRTRQAVAGPGANGLSEGLVPLLDAIDLLEPAREDCGLFELQFGVITRGTTKTGRAANLLLHELAPEGWVYLLPFEFMSRWLDESEPGALSTDMLTIVQDTELYLMYDFDAQEVEAFRARFTRLFGFDIFISCGRIGRSELLMLKSLESRIRSGDEQARRFARLLPS